MREGQMDSWTGSAYNEPFSVTKWLGCQTFFGSLSPNLKVESSIPHAINSANLDSQCCV